MGIEVVNIQKTNYSIGEDFKLEYDLNLGIVVVLEIPIQSININTEIPK